MSQKDGSSNPGEPGSDRDWKTLSQHKPFTNLGKIRKRKERDGFCRCA